MTTEETTEHITKIISWNIEGGISNKKAKIHNLIANHNANIVLLQDTRQKKDFEIARKWFKVHGHIQTEAHPSGGVLTAVQLNTVHREEYPDSHKNIIITRITEPIAFTIINIYLQPSVWEESFQILDDIVTRIDTPVIIMGDFNAHHRLWYSNHNDNKGEKVMDFCNRHNLMVKDLNKPTRVDRRNNTQTHIDLTIITPSLYPILSWDTDCETHGSDHYPIILTLERSPPYKPIEMWRFKQADWKLFNQTLDLALPDEMNNIDDQVEWITNQIRTAALISIPRGSNLRKFPVPWWNEECARARREKRRIERRMWRNQGDQRIAEDFEEACKAYQTTIEKAKNDSWMAFTSSLKVGAPSKIVWDRVMAVAGKKNRQPIKPIYHNGEKYETKNEIAEFIAMKIGKQSSTEKSTNAFKVYKATEDKNIISFDEPNEDEKPITWQEFETLIQDSRRSAMGPDEVNFLMLAKMEKVHQKQIFELFKNIWESGRYPKAWKTADIVPLIKPGKDLTDPRPISLTNCLARIFDKLINSRLYYELERKIAIPIEQAAFRVSRSTIDPVVGLEAEIRHSLAEKLITTCVFIDIEKAYDSCYPNTVLQELQRLGFKGKLPNIIKSFMTNRKAKVKLIDTKSSEIELDLGIPQGSSLSCSLFSIAMNTVIREIKDGVKAFLYVDDLVIFHSSDSIQKNTTILQRSINSIIQWSDRTNLRISTVKTKTVHFHRIKKGTNIRPPIIINGTPIEEVTDFKYLGIHFDRTLTWAKHVNSIEAKARRRLNLLKVLTNKKFGADARIMKNIYLAIIRPIMEYGAPVIISASQTTILKLERVQREALRIILGAHRTTPISSMYWETNLEDINTCLEKRAISYYTRTASIREHPIAQILRTPVDQARLTNHPRTKGTFSNRIKSLLEKWGLPTDPIEQRIDLRKPEWEMKNIQICQDTIHMEKLECTPILKSIMLQHIPTHLGEIIFCDGSKSSEGTGAAFVHLKDGVSNTKKFKILGLKSSFFAEALGIAKALQYVHHNNFKRTTIFCDNKSAILALTTKNHNCNIIRNCRNIAHDIINRGNEISICWSPGHIGIPGNELADKAAKSALNTGTNIETFVNRHDVKHLLKENIKTKAQQEWNNLNLHLKKYKPKYGPLQILDTNRNTDVLLRRLKLGHTSVTHDYLFKGPSEQAPSCDCMANLSVRHYIYECPNNPNALQGKTPDPDDFINPAHKNILIDTAQLFK